MTTGTLNAEIIKSLSARRAWIEKDQLEQAKVIGPVALRKESVDRKFGRSALSGPRAQSLSARRAWIEMTNSKNRKRRSKVALRKESVDRNLTFSFRLTLSVRRSPQGERG